jgi:hypothetical protein
MRTLILTRGAHRIDASTADQVTRAISEKQPFIDICADVLGDGLRFEKVRLFVGHVVAIIDDDDSEKTEFSIESLGNVRRIR